MPVVPDPSAPPIIGPGIVYSPVSSLSQVAIPISCGVYWLVVPDRPDLNMELPVLSPTSAIMPGGMQATPSHHIEQVRPQTIHEVMGSEYPIITKARKPKSDSFGLDFALVGEAAWEAFKTIWATQDVCLLQSDLTDQWYVDMGETRKLNEVQSTSPDWTTMYVVSLSCREVAPV